MLASNYKAQSDLVIKIEIYIAKFHPEEHATHNLYNVNQFYVS